MGKGSPRFTDKSLDIMHPTPMTTFSKLIIDYIGVEVN